MSVTIGERVAAVLLAGGAGTRFGAPVSKVYVPLGGRPVLAHALEVLDTSEDVDDIVLVVRADDVADCDDVLHDAPRAKVRAVVTGGTTRQASEWAGIQAVRDRVEGADLVMLHDAARPFTTLDLIADLVSVARNTGGGALPARPLQGDLADAAGHPVDSAPLVAVQTPQVFSLRVLLQAYPRAAAAGFEGVDTAQTVQAHHDTAVTWVPGDARNLKLTHADDLMTAESLLPGWHRGAWTR